jgi:hypothetical protein
MFHKKVAPSYQALLLPVLLTIVPLCIQWENGGVVRKKDAGGGGIVVVEATLFGCVSYLHPQLGDRLVMVGDRMTSHISPQFEPLLKEWQRPGSGRTESDIDELISERHLRSRDTWDLKVDLYFCRFLKVFGFSIPILFSTFEILDHLLSVGILISVVSMPINFKGHRQYYNSFSPICP